MSRRRPAALVAAAAIACGATALTGPALLASPASAAPAMPVRAATTSPTTTPGATPSGTADPGPVTPSKVTDRVVSDRRISESSGLVLSRTMKNVLWTFNDSGGTADLYGIGPTGEVVADLDLRGGAAVDWEAAAPLVGPKGRPYLAIGDIGDNPGDRPFVTVYVVAEPTSTGEAKVRPYRTIHLTYPDGPTDAEALFVDPTSRRMYVVSKGLVGGTLFAVPQSVWPGTADTPDDVDAELVPVASVPLVMVTDAVALADGRVVLRTYGDLNMMPPVASVESGGAWRPAAATVSPQQGQGEGVAATRSGVLLLSTEGKNKAILRFTPPADFLAAGRFVEAPTATPTPSTGGGTASGTAGATADPADDGGPSDGDLLRAAGLVAAGVVGGSFVVGTTAALLRRRRPERRGR